MYNTQIPHPACLGGQYFFFFFSVPACPWIAMGKVLGWCQFILEEYKSEAIVWEDTMCMWNQNAVPKHGTRNLPFLKKYTYSSEMGLTKSYYQVLMASQAGGSFLQDLTFVIKEGTGCSVYMCVCTYDLAFSPSLKNKKKCCLLRNVTVHF